MAFGKKGGGQTAGKRADDLPCLVKQVFNKKGLMRKSVFMRPLKECVTPDKGLNVNRINGRLISDLYFDFVSNEGSAKGGLLKNHSLSDVFKITVDAGLKRNGSEMPEERFVPKDNKLSYSITLAGLLGVVGKATNNGAHSTRLFNKDHYVAVRDHLAELNR